MCCEHCLADFDAESGYPEVTNAGRWVAVQFHKRAPVLVLEEDGTVTERFTVPGDVAQLPLPGVPAARPVVTLATAGGVL